MKKLFGILLCLTLVFGMTGCAKAATETATAFEASTETEIISGASVTDTDLAIEDVESVIASETPAPVEPSTFQKEAEAISAEPVTDTEQATAEPATEQGADYQSSEDYEMKLFINDIEIPVLWESCTAVDELMAEAANGSITVSMSMYGDWEQVGSLGRAYTRDDSHMTAVNGDIVLYSGNQIVLFYGSNSWSYTKLGKMDLSADEVTELLSTGDITLTITK